MIKDIQIPLLHPIKNKKSNFAIADEWDKIASSRDKQIRTGLDISHSHILTPSILRLSEFCNFESVLDVGCGTGVLTEKLAEISDKVVGIDMSKKSIEIARKYNSDLKNISYADSSIENFPDGINRYSLITANMVLQDVNDLDGVVQAFYKLTTRGSHVVATITHPCFWPLYWGYLTKDWFSYAEEIGIEAVFKISKDLRGAGVTTHFHRPLEKYFDLFKEQGFLLEEVIAPMPTHEVERLYPKQWQYPRFLGMRFRRL
jgi:2-polyprenyl-3-methyl-5-hydroxy-6-metoxy-1,4-benzoquinol methylase